MNSFSLTLELNGVVSGEVPTGSVLYAFKTQEEGSPRVRLVIVWFCVCERLPFWALWVIIA